MPKRQGKSSTDGRERKVHAAHHLWKPAFLAAYELNGVIATTARQVGIDQSTVFQAVKEDPTFAAAFEQAKNVFVDRLEKEAVRRATQGVEEPVYQGGMMVGTRLRYSDQLMQFLLERRRYPRALRLEGVASASDEGRAIAAAIAAGLATVPEQPPQEGAAPKP